MPQLTAALPRYRKHRASGQALVHLSGKDFYLGPYGTQASRHEYDRLISEWLSQGRRLRPPSAQPQELTLTELMAAYNRHAKAYYVKNGQPTNEPKMIAAAMKFLRRLYGRELVSDFGPLKLQAVQQAMISADLCRGQINRQIDRLKRMFRWGVTQELVPAEVLHAIRELRGLAKGRTTARETSPIMPVPDEVIAATLLRLPPVVADMVRLQRATGTRPEEICFLRPVEIDTSGDVWVYHPSSHKTVHQGRERTIFIGPIGQQILAKYLDQGAEGVLLFAGRIGGGPKSTQSSDEEDTCLVW